MPIRRDTLGRFAPGGVAAQTKIATGSMRLEVAPSSSVGIALNSHASRYIGELLDTFEYQAPWPCQTAGELISTLQEDSRGLEETWMALEEQAIAKNPSLAQMIENGEAEYAVNLDDISAKDLVSRCEELLGY